MATNYIDPSANGANTAWTNGATGATRLDDGVRSPTDARTSGDGLFISSSTDEQLQDIVFPNTLVFNSAQTIKVYIYGSGGAKRAVDVQISTNDGVTWNTRQANVIGANAAAGWYTLDITADILLQLNLDQLRVRLICNATAGGGGASAVQVDAVYIEQIVTDPGRLDVSQAALEVPDATPNGRLDAAQVFLEVPDQPSGRLDVSQAFLETPNAPDGRLDVSFAALETPDLDSRLDVSQVAFEVPDANGELQVSKVEFEVPDVDGRLDVSKAEFEVEAADGRLDVSQAFLQVPEFGAPSQKPRLVGHIVRRKPLTHTPRR